MNNKNKGGRGFKVNICLLHFQLKDIFPAEITGIYLYIHWILKTEGMGMSGRKESELKDGAY